MRNFRAKADAMVQDVTPDRRVAQRGVTGDRYGASGHPSTEA
jgi:hypothetical protein